MAASRQQQAQLRHLALAAEQSPRIQVQAACSGDNLVRMSGGEGRAARRRQAGWSTYPNVQEQAALLHRPLACAEDGVAAGGRGPMGCGNVGYMSWLRAGWCGLQQLVVPVAVAIYMCQ